MKRVYLDLDDVLVHMHLAIAERRGVTVDQLDATSGEPFDFEKIFGCDAAIFGELDADWWANLPATPWKNQVVDFALSCVPGGWGDIHVVTALPIEYDPRACGAAVEGKMEWCRRNLPDLPKKQIVFATYKGLLTAPDVILIDDMQKNVDKFGLNGVLIPSRWNSRHPHFKEFGGDPGGYLAREYGGFSLFVLES